QVFIAIADQDNPFAGAFRKRRQRQLDRRRDVGVVAVDVADNILEMEVEKRGVARRKLQARSAAEQNQAGAVVLVLGTALGHSIVEELFHAVPAEIDARRIGRRVGLEFLRDAQRAIDQEQYRDIFVLV